MTKTKKISLGLCFLVFFAAGYVVARLSHGSFSSYFGGPLHAIITSRSPLAYWRVQQRGWNSFNELKYTQDRDALHLRRFVETGLLPLILNGRRLSDAYPVPKMGGAITVVGTTVLILDRLGGLYRYDLTAGAFGRLEGIPQLPNNLKAFLVHRPGPPVNLADAPNDEFRARDIIYLPDRKELAVAYDKYDETIGKLRTVVSLIPFDAATLTASGAWREIFASDVFNYGDNITQGAGMLAYRGRGKLYVSIGDHAIVDPKVSEDPNTTFGKIIEINLDTNQWHQFSKGHRNPEGLSFLKSGELVETEHGPRGGDELNVIIEGGDYGWPNVTLGTGYNTYGWPSSTAVIGRHTGYKPPLFAWVPSIAPTQVIEVNNFDPRWDGDLLVGTLKGESLYRLRLEAGRVLYSERIWIGDRIRDIVQASDGTIILWTDDTKLLFITVDKDQLAVGRRTAPLLDTAMVSENCLGCHHFGPTSPTDFAPSLSNLLNRPIASDTFSYSNALRAKQKLGPWTPTLLAEFLSDPFEFASGTTMLPLALTPTQIDEIVKTLIRASGQSAGNTPPP